MTPKILLTAAEAYPELERLFLNARAEISAGFRIFDPQTRLRSPEGQQTGATWADLLTVTLNRGVSIRMVLADFDPVVAPSLHRLAWRCAEGLRNAAQRSDHPEALEVIVSMHSAKLGLFPQLILSPKMLHEVYNETRRLNAMTPAAAARDLELMPMLAPYLRGHYPKLRPNWVRVPDISPATHHQKMAVFDGETLYVGGLDLNERRFDTPEHDRPGAQTWHDTQLVVRGPAARAAQVHLAQMLPVIAGEAPLTPHPELVRTLSRRRKTPWIAMSPKTIEDGIFRALRDGIARSDGLIYMETQYFRSRALAGLLVAAAQAKPALQLLMVLPAAPDDVAFENSGGMDARYGEYLQARSVQSVQKAFGERCFFMAPAQPRGGHAPDRAGLKGAPLVYLHSKVSIFDARAAMVSSANLNGRSLKWDTETGVRLQDPDQARALLDRCFDHWLPENADAALRDPATAVGAWRDLARANAACAPDARSGFVMAYPVRPAKRFGRNLPGFPEELV